MTAAEKRAASYKTLIANIRSDWESCQAQVDSIMELVQKLEKDQGPVRGSDVMAVAAYLHHFYTGIEAILERISKAFDGGQPLGGDYHRELLRSMTLEIPDVRPAIITKDLWDELDEFRRFRHMFRHAYGAELRWRKVETLASKTESLRGSLNDQIENYIKFVEGLIKDINGH
ncbi:hypothetical protein JCM15765_10570 [Paradesulfitobacterium aromaticivorans]